SPRPAEPALRAVAVAASRLVVVGRGLAVLRDRRHRDAVRVLPGCLEKALPAPLPRARSRPPAGGGLHPRRRWTMKIGLLAMSGIRAHDPELLVLGLTLPGFVERSKTVASLPSLGLLDLAACTPDGHSLTYFEAEGDRSEPAEVYQCDL